jgi:hypothetical protein
MLSVAQGQDFAQSMDFSQPSQDVREAETMDVLSRWALFVNQGIFEAIGEGAGWLLELLEKTDKLITPKDELYPLFAAFGVAMLNKLLDDGSITIVIDEELLDEK